MEKYDLTQGSIWKKLFYYFLPLAAGTIFQQLYSAVDGIVVSKYVGTVALAAVGGSAALISNALINFFVSLTGGGSVIISQFYGANNKSSVSRAVHTSMIFSLICGIVISVAGYILTPQMLTAMKTPADSMPQAVIYLRIIFTGVVFQLVYNMAASVLRAVGDSKSSFEYLAVSCTLNIVLDILAVKTLNMGVAGAAYATVLSQAICCAIAVIKLLKSSEECYGLRMKDLKLDFKILQRVLALGVPMAFQSLMYSITNLMIQASLNTLGTVIVASWALTSKVDGFFWGFMNAAGTSISTFVGQNFGKGDVNRVKGGVKASMVMFMIVSIAFSAILLGFGRFFLSIFTYDSAVIDCAYEIMWYFAPYYWIWVINEVLSGALRGEGKTLAAFIITAICICLFRIAWTYTLFGMIPTLKCLSMQYAASWTLAGIVMAIYYNRSRRAKLCSH